MTIDVLIEKDALREALATYCHTLDGGDLKAWVETFTMDGVWDGGPIGKFTGPSELKAFAESLPDIFGPATLRHSVSNIMITVSGDTAHVKAYLNLFQAGEPGNSPPKFLDAALYDIDYVKEDGRWLIKYMRVIHP